MNKALVRILLFFIGLPAVLALAFWNWASHLPLTIAALAVSALGADETASLLRHRGLTLNRILPFSLGKLLPCLAYLENAHLLTTDQSLAVVALALVAVFVSPIFTGTEADLQPVLGKVAGSVFVLVYPGLFLYYLLKINSLPEARYLTPVFLLSTFGNDAWACVLFARETRSSHRHVVRG